MEKLDKLKSELKDLGMVLYNTTIDIRRIRKEIYILEYPATTPCDLDYYGIRAGECKSASVVGTHDTINCANPKCLHFIK